MTTKHGNTVTYNDRLPGTYQGRNNIEISEIATIMFIICRDFLIVEQMFSSLQRSVIVSNKLVYSYNLVVPWK